MAINMEELGAGEILLQNIEREGLLSGYDLEIVREVSEAVRIPGVASGGASKIADFELAIKAGASAIAAGGMFVFKGSQRAILINYPSQEVLKMELYNKL